jgi:SAM-dependent methyltransferase
MSIRSSSRAHRANRILGRAILSAVLASAVALRASAQEKAPDAPFVPTPVAVVERMLELAKVGKDDVVYDLGSGDGRMVITAAHRYGARGVGIEINPVWVRDAQRYAEALKVADRVTFRVDDLFTADLREATVVMLYLLPWMNRKLAPKFRSELKPGARIVSHEYGIGDWPPDHTEEMVVNGERHLIHLWTVRATTVPQ